MSKLHQELQTEARVLGEGDLLEADPTGMATERPLLSSKLS